MNYEKWEQSIHKEMKEDRLWSVKAYRLSLFAYDIGWHDITKLSKDKRTFSISDQLARSLGSIGANIAEGYSRGTGKDRARFYEYSLGSARESKDWYYKSRFILGPEVTQHRISLLSEIIKLLLTMIPQQRKGEIRERPDDYFTFNELLEVVPLP